MEDPNLHLSVFLEVCDTLKSNGASTDAIRLHLFLFLLWDKARAWLHSLPQGRSQHGRSSRRPSSPNFSHLARRRAWEPDHVLYPERGWVLVWGMGAVQRFAEAMPQSWPSPLCDRCGSLEHVFQNCQVVNPVAPSHVEHAAYMNNF